MTAKVWSRPRRFLTRGACHRLEYAGWYWFWWRSKAGWNAHVFRDVALDRPDETFVWNDPELEEAGIRSVCTVEKEPDVGKCIAAMQLLLGKRWRPNFADAVAQELGGKS